MARITNFWYFFIGGIGLMVIGAYLIIPSEVTYEQESDKHQISYYQQLIHSNYSIRGTDLNPQTYTNVDRLIINFITIDVFSVNNPYNVDIKVILKNPEKIDVVLFNLPTVSSNFDNLKNPQDLINYLYARGEQGLVYSLNKTTDGNFEGHLHLLPLIPEDYKALFVLFTPITQNGTKLALSFEKLDVNEKLITIEPHTAILQAQSDENSQIQILNTNRTNNVVEGLTWIIVGAIPLEYAIQYRRRNQEKLEEHRRILNESFVQYYNRTANVTLRLLPILQQFPDTRLYLQHVFTTHFALDISIRNLIAIELQMPQVGIQVPRPLSVRHTNAFASFRQQFEAVQNDMRQHIEDIGGICENCIKLHDIQGLKFKEMRSSLESFTMPF